MTNLFTLSAKHSAHFAAMLTHARHCRKCQKPILDSEGQPSQKATACLHGQELLTTLARLERVLFTVPATVMFTRTRM